MANEKNGTGKKKTVIKKKPVIRKKAARKTSRSIVRQNAALPDGDIAPDANRAASTESQFPIVAIGASAGGLEAFDAFFKAMPPDSGMAFILIAHLDPTHVSLLPELLQKSTRMNVQPISDAMKIKSNQVYVIPPNKDLNILHGVLHLAELTLPRGTRLPIDNFFRSLAQDQGPNAICIVLSGTGTDGTLGVKAIKGEVGMVMVQDEATAKYDGMPRSAVATGLADYILAPDKMPEELIKYAKNALGRSRPRIIPDTGPTPDALQQIFIVLRARTDHDFSLYKKNTICRRVERRMNVHHIDDIDDYVRYLSRSDLEVKILFKELLIGVTNFFRDPEAFVVLGKKIIPDLLAERSEDYPVRVWVPGCSSGEEAYSVAILLHEYMESSRHFSVQIFGTDIDEDAINAARNGLYPTSIQSDISPERLKRYFIREDDGQYRVKKIIREMLVFAPQNVIKDPPFTKLDLIACRNLLIYLDAELQQKLLPIFHYSLKTDGILFLGSSESIGQATDLFEVRNKKWKIFRRKPSSATIHAPLAIPVPVETPEHSLDKDSITEAVKRTEELSVQQLVETILTQSDIPPCIIIDDAYDLVYVHGHTGRYLEPAQGRVTVNALEMARPGLKAELANAIKRVSRQKQEVSLEDLRVEHDGEHFNFNLIARPILEQGPLRNLIMIIFEEVAGATKKPGAKTKRGSKVVKLRGISAEDIDQELQFTKESLQSTIEELETSNEELTSTNEELQSTNEELQSTNEEMETSKEELQSLNEESATVNAELQSRIDELAISNDDLKNFFDSTNVATLFLDADMRIRRFTPPVTEIFPLAATDSERPIQHFASKLIDFDLADQARGVLDDLVVRDLDLKSDDGHYYHVKILPYRTAANLIDGVVVTFNDITESKVSQTGLLRRLAAVVTDSNDAITLQTREGAIVAWNFGARQMYGYSEEEALGMNIKDIVPKDKSNEALDIIKSAFAEEIFNPVETQRRSKDGRTLDVSLTVTIIKDDQGQPELIATTERDVTERNKSDAMRREFDKRFRLALQSSEIVVFEQDKDLRYTWIHNPHPDFKAEEVLGKTDQELLSDDPESAAVLTQFKRSLLVSGKAARMNLTYSIGGEIVTYDMVGEPILDENAVVQGLLIAATNITGRTKTSSASS